MQASKSETTVDALLPYYERMNAVVCLILYQEYRENGSFKEAFNLGLTRGFEFLSLWVNQCKTMKDMFDFDIWKLLKMDSMEM